MHLFRCQSHGVLLIGFKWHVLNSIAILFGSKIHYIYGQEQKIYSWKICKLFEIAVSIFTNFRFDLIKRQFHVLGLDRCCVNVCFAKLKRRSHKLEAGGIHDNEPY